MPIASFTLDLAAHVTSWSPAAAAWSGRPAPDVLGRHCGAVFAGPARDALAEAVGRAAAGGDYSRVVPVVSGDGARQDVLLTCSPLMPGGPGDDGGGPLLGGAVTGLLCELGDPSQHERPSQHGSSSQHGTGPQSDGPSHHGRGAAVEAPAAEASDGAAPGGRASSVDAFVRSSPHGMGILDTDLRYVMVNDALAGFNGIPAEEHVGRSVGDVVRAADRGEYERHLRGVLETGEPLHNVLISGRTEGHRDRDRVWSVTFFRLTSDDGRVLGLGGLIVDVTQRQTALLEASGVRRRLDLVNRSGSKVGTTLDMGRTARELVEFVVPDFADVATVEMRTDYLEGSAFADSGRPAATVVLAGRGTAGDGSGRLREAVSGSRREHPAGSPAHRCLSSGLSWHEGKLRAEDAAALVPQDVLPGPPEEAAPDSGVVAPLVARGRCLGLVTLGRFADRDALDEDDRSVAEELAARTALSLDNARLYDDERRTAVALQRNMLPGEKDIPVRQGLEIGYHYWSTSRSANVGGDFFDVIPLSGHRVALVVGDVMGHDIHAAAGMGRLRTAMHTLARLDLEPVELLTRLDGIVESSPAMQHATCVYAVYNTVTRECGIASAGHPPPILRHRDSTSRLIPVEPGVPLGIGLVAPDYPVTELALPEGGTLVLYTDGLVEQRGDIGDGIAALASVLAAPGPSVFSVQQWCDDVVVRMAPRSAGDDLAILMARATPTPRNRSVRWNLPPEPAMASKARELIDRTLDDWGLDALRGVTGLLANELVTNAFRHGRGDVGIQLARGDSLVVEVSDSDERLPHRAEATPDGQWGRGLKLVDELAAKWGARSVTSGKVVWFELPLAR